MANELTSDAPMQHSSLGKWVTRCGPKGKAATFSLVLIFGLMGIGVFSFIVAYTVRPQPGSEAMPTVFNILGAGLIVIGLLSLYIISRPSHPQIDLYTGGFRFKTKRDELFISWDQVTKAILFDIYDTRFSSYRQLQFSALDKKDLSFNSKVEGEPQEVIDGIAENLNNIERKVIDFGA